MQFHLNGFRTGAPDMQEAVPASLTDIVDVLIVGCGPAGLTLAAQLAAFPEISTRIVERKAGPLELGQADGIACRTMEMFNAFGFADRVEREAYWVNETTFWKPVDDAGHRIIRHGRIPDTEEGLSEFPHVILNQARVHDFYLEKMRNAPTRLKPDYGLRLVDLTVPEELDAPVVVRLQPVDAEGEEGIETIRARYVVGCDGARSGVRACIGRELRGDSANQAWGVMDVLAYTDFPDIRLKTAIHSANEGSILIIPREGGYLVRLYVELDKLAADERVSSKNITQDRLVAAAQRILHPYTLDVKQVAWWSVYEIGQRLTDKFDDVPAGEEDNRLPRVFIAGDACHTHSPKAGQGMNVSMQDTFNLGWKLAAVLRGLAGAELLHSYSAERQAIAQELIDFDREFARMFSAKPKTAEDDDGIDPAEFQRYFIRQGRFTAGTATRYAASRLTGQGQDQALAGGLPVGMRFHSAPVIRLADAKPMQLGHVHEADGRWRIYLFAGAEGLGGDFAALCDWLSSADSPVHRHTPAAADVDAVFDVRAVFQTSHQAMSMDELPEILWPQKGRLGLRDYEKAFCVDPAADIYDMRAIDRARGCVVVVRPDQYIAEVLPLDAREQLKRYFAGLLTCR
ncbi:phenol 2-monooxygenase [Haematobacter massiliensis]|uniref:Phenol 2-monooxygenase n=1 Tax=Haematobacter massiliensis TaxID=195105 RepID=A0A086Y6V7_9RHOB|nr:FAD-binding monooxygenase [Haematobacter massiliensis]KFI30007.1 phenol 2-monooxygenase [Haematobacter massiliensis]OWJ69400.1 phenol 2-monooxygenase [Haematobacter massiliensis]OWJ86943.1 phenol 2-monooxygenase [Haematobacter massiliensis]QBJ25512.1 3-hydroxybenzoate 4-monooxygenase [Haematobacter massiliensis]